ncbi:unnamed protein product [Trifolium pratense]|uniref:Uncharacterized protein n=1 Tax=Trifolium pratense TaxID=57577 RepID=A0ACB0K8B7_TRIPR|nr:unnamed protein product [Trifolium pratense]
MKFCRAADEIVVFLLLSHPSSLNFFTSYNSPVSYRFFNFLWDNIPHLAYFPYIIKFEGPKKILKALTPIKRKYFNGGSRVGPNSGGEWCLSRRRKTC